MQTSDDEELVTIRVPKRAAALFGAQMDYISSPFMIGLQISVGYILASIPALWVVFLCVRLAINGVTENDIVSATIFIGAPTAISLGLFAYARSYHKTIRRRLAALDKPTP